MPEIHGCGDAASAHARKAFRESTTRDRKRDDDAKWTGGVRIEGGNSVFLGKSYAGSAWGKAQAQQRLRGKIEQEKKKRTTQKKDDKGPKP
ncbi:R3H domain-containing protein [Besnoitia besnoiti]|uniref:R3H domain-containing protein n=1 Tax=Besnoitia besnoiti TaxID=94643 RepID=A0A2A9MEL3_BESBE|nr:R3H domain-containing protein [Besnoitia besnoiti]PFH35644.1 R3H domain-containing protein [Besnoitia besnoiti]